MVKRVWPIGLMNSTSGRPCSALVASLRIHVPPLQRSEDSRHHHHRTCPSTRAFSISINLRLALARPNASSAQRLLGCVHALCTHKIATASILEPTYLGHHCERAPIQLRTLPTANPTICTLDIPKMHPVHTTTSSHSTGTRIRQESKGYRQAQRRGCLP